MSSAFGLIRSSLNSLSTRLGMGSEQSQESRSDIKSQASQKQVDDFYKDSSSGESDTARLKSSMAQPQKIELSPQEDLITPKPKRKRKRKSGNSLRKRRSSNGTSNETTESILSDETHKLDHATTAAKDESMLDGKVSKAEGLSPVDDNEREVDTEATITSNSDLKSPASETIKISPSTLEQSKSAVVAATPNKKIKRHSGALRMSNKASKAEYPCPGAEKYGCQKTFGLLSDAKRHAQNTHEFSQSHCSVCSKFLPKGIMRAHMAKHSAAEIQASQNRDDIETTDQSAEEDSKKLPTPEIQPLTNEGSGADILETIEEPHVSEIIDYPELPTDKQQAMPEASKELPSPESLPAVPDSEPLHATEPEIVMASATEESFEQASTIPDSGFDEPMDQEVIQETPEAVRTLKRRRDTADGDLVSSATAPASKRPRRDIFSPPRSLSPEQPTEIEPEDKIVPRPRMRQLWPQRSRSGNLESFAKPLAPGSQLYHPIHNPRTPKVLSTRRVEVVIPRTSRAGPSKTKFSEKIQRALDKEIQDTLNESDTVDNRKQKSAYTSPKGKRRAEPNVDYSTPLRQAQSKPVDNDDAEDESQRSKRTERNGMATSVARRTSSQKASRKSASSRGKQRSEDDDPDSSDSDDNSHISHGDKENGTAKDTFMCQECRRKFGTRDALKRHEKIPNIHTKPHQCEDCSAAFARRSKLAEHEVQTGHGDGTGDGGRKGHFSPVEIDKLHSWRDRFCDEFDLDLTEFNQMMVDTSKRTKDFEWPHRFISKADYIQQYLDVLPNRSRRSMLRYRERHFQNVPDNQKWTDEDDDELVNLVKEIGPKWVEIGQRMTRTQDSVNQRWRHKLKYRGKAMEGEWLAQDAEFLVKAVNQVKRESNLSLDPNEDVKIPWDLVSKKLKGKRTAQQCSNKWRVMHTRKKDGRRVRTPHVDRMPDTPNAMATPSKMSQRIAGSTPQTQSSKPSGSTIKKRKHVSDARVTEPDESASNDAEPPATQNDNIEIPSSMQPTLTAIQKRRKQQAMMSIESTNPISSPNKNLDFEDEAASSPTLPRNPLPARTPARHDVSSISQMMNQTQANTSALRGGTTTAKKQTQAERPSPNIPVQMRPESSPLRMISTNGGAKAEEQQAEESDEEESDEESEQNDDDKEKRPDDLDLINGRVSETSGTDDEQQEEDSEDVASASASASKSMSEDSEEEEEEESDSTNPNTKASFMQSLQSPPQPESATISKKIDFTKAVQAKGNEESESESEEESSDDDDEGDIMFN